MDFRTRVTRWEHWRTLMGARSSRQRRDVMDFLQSRPALLYVGDSWFSTPLYPNLARQSTDRIDGMAMLTGDPGATSAQLLSRWQVSGLLGRLREWPFDVLCLSVGGNDLLGERLARHFSAWMPGASRPTPPRLSAAAAFARVRAAGGYQASFEHYVRLLDGLERLVAERRHFRVLAHGYVPPVRIGAKGALNLSNIGLIAWLKSDVGPWLWQPMQHVLPDRDEARAFARLLLAGFEDAVLRPLGEHPRYGEYFAYADFSQVPGIASEDFWYDEIHPDEDGFALLADAFNGALRPLLPAAKRMAVH